MSASIDKAVQPIVLSFARRKIPWPLRAFSPMRNTQAVGRLQV